MSRLDEIEPFWKMVLHQWVYLVTSSIVAALITASVLLGAPVPLWGGLVLTVFFVGCAIWSAGESTHKKRLELAKKVLLVLRIGGVTRRIKESESERHCIEVYNESLGTVRFGARLEAIEPPLDGFPSSPRLRLTNTPYPHLEADVPALPSPALVDVFDDWLHGRTNIRLLVVAERPELAFPVAPDPLAISRQRYKITISVFPVHPSTGGPTTRDFYIIPQPHGGMIFSSAS
jgi:hypothetical protein